MESISHQSSRFLKIKNNKKIIKKELWKDWILTRLIKFHHISYPYKKEKISFNADVIMMKGHTPLKIYARGTWMLSMSKTPTVARTLSSAGAWWTGRNLTLWSLNSWIQKHLASKARTRKRSCPPKSKFMTWYKTPGIKLNKKSDESKIVMSTKVRDKLNLTLSYSSQERRLTSVKPQKLSLSKVMKHWKEQNTFNRF